MLNIFVSHTHKDKDLVQKIDKIVCDRYHKSSDKDEPIKFSISSNKNKGPQPGTNWKNWINEKIDCCDLMFVLITSNTKNSKWIKSEIEYAQKKNKHIVPILINNECKIPESLNKIQAIKDAENETDNITEEIINGIMSKINDALKLKTRSNSDRIVAISVLVLSILLLGKRSMQKTVQALL